MKFTDLSVVEDIGRDQMTEVHGGVTWGDFLTDGIAAAGTGRARLPEVKESEAIFGASNLGRLIQVASDVGGLPGNNGGIAFFNSLGFDIHSAPGLAKRASP